MPRFFCDYCDAYLTHDSPNGRRQHIRGWKHREAFKLYYEKFFPEFMQEQEAQKQIQQIQHMQQMQMMMQQQQHQILSQQGVPPPPLGSQVVNNLPPGQPGQFLPPGSSFQPPPSLQVPPSIPSTQQQPQIVTISDTK
jgi:U1 small nuclear ribonucleoprotein C